MSGPICFLSDFGSEDGYVGVVKGVILAIRPMVSLVDLSHGVPPQDVRAGAFLLRTAVPYFPAGTIYLAVVDPGVGTERSAVAVRVGGCHFVGPDNGLLSWAILRQARAVAATVELADDALRLGAGISAVALSQPRFWLPTVSATFHGRDILGPVAAHLSAGIALGELGPAVTSIRALAYPMPMRRADGPEMVGEVIYVDRFGNLVTNLESGDVTAQAAIRVGESVIRGLSPHFQQDAELVALVGSSGLLEIAVPNGSAAMRLKLGVGARIRVVAPPD